MVPRRALWRCYYQLSRRMGSPRRSLEGGKGQRVQAKSALWETPKIAACTWLLKLLDSTQLLMTVFSGQVFETGHQTYDRVTEFHKIPRTSVEVETGKHCRTFNSKYGTEVMDSWTPAAQRAKKKMDSEKLVGPIDDARIKRPNGL